MIVFIENYNQYLRIYYGDGHQEIVDSTLKDFASILKQKNTYKNPIQVGDDYLYPTQSARDEACCWVNLKSLENLDEYLICILKQKKLYMKAVNEYLSQKKKQLIHSKDSELI